jgi:hypothetical protein
MSFYPQIARENYNARTGEYIPDWQKLAKAHKGIKISEVNLKNGHFGAYSPAYVTTNEDWRFAMQELNPRDKSVLTVMGSGDQAIAFAVSGAKLVDTFDISYFARVMMDIKSAAIQTMNHEEYSEFINNLYDTKSLNELDGYKKIEPICPKSSLTVTRQMRGYKIFNHGLGASREYMPTPTEYQAAQEIIHTPVNFIWSDLDNLHTHLKKKYDIIYLSNIFEYFATAPEITAVLNKLMSHLNINGQIMMYTSWIHTNTSAIIVNAATKCDWGKIKSHEQQNAVMLTLTRTR